MTDWRSSSSASQAGTNKRQYTSVEKNTSSTLETDYYTNFYNDNKEAYINFGGSSNNLHHHYSHQVNHHYHHEQKPEVFNTNIDPRNNHQLMMMNSSSQVATQQQPQLITASSSNLWLNNPSAATASDFLSYENWDELGSVVKFAFDSSM